MRKLKLNINKKVIKTAAIAFLIICIGTGGYFTYNKYYSSKNLKSVSDEAIAKVQRGDLNVTITGTGTISPISEYNIVPLIKGTILESPFEEGMSVKKGDLLYEIDDSDLSYSIEKSQNSLEKQILTNKQTQESIDNLQVVSPDEGIISNFTLKVGDQVSANSKIADLLDNKHITVTLKYNSSQISKIKLGANAQILLADFMSYYNGTVTYINATPGVASGGGALYDVELTMDNPGAVSEGTEATGIITGTDGTQLQSVASGVTAYVKKPSVYAKTAGTVKQVLIKNGEWVSGGQKTIILENKDLEDNMYTNSLSLKDTQLSLESLKKQQSDYIVLSPIDGTVIAKDYKAGDTINNSNSSNVLMTVADMSKMIFTISVDELDISKVSVGQKVEVTSDAVSGTKFEGEVTAIQVKGETKSGVTTYPVEVTIASPGKLRPGMNVNAKIEVENKKDILYLPVAAVTKVEDKSYVTLKQSTSGNGGNSGRNGPGNRTEVTLGINNDNFIEIVSGLNEGDEVVYSAATGNSETRQQTGGMMGGAMGGGMGGPPPGR